MAIKGNGEIYGKGKGTTTSRKRHAECIYSKDKMYGKINGTRGTRCVTRIEKKRPV